MGRPRVCVSLRFSGDDLDPDEITTALHCVPSHACRKGERIPAKDARRPWRTGIWCLDLPQKEDAPFDDQVRELLGRLSPDLDVWCRLTARFRADVFIGVFLATGNDGLNVSPETMRELGARGIEIDFDIYAIFGPSSDTDDDSKEPGRGGPVDHGA